MVFCPQMVSQEISYNLHILTALHAKRVCRELRMNGPTGELRLIFRSSQLLVALLIFDREVVRRCGAKAKERELEGERDGGRDWCMQMYTQISAMCTRVHSYFWMVFLCAIFFYAVLLTTLYPLPLFPFSISLLHAQSYSNGAWHLLATHSCQSKTCHTAKQPQG